MPLTLDHLRAVGARTLVMLMWAGALATWFIGYYVNSPQIWTATLVSILVAALPTYNLLIGKCSSTTRIINGLSAPLTPAVLVFVTHDQLWQIDMHMTFFAVLAALLIVCDWRAILAGTIVIAAHHITLNLVGPAFIFSNGPSFPRVILHAVVVLIEAGVLMWTALKLTALLEQSNQALEAAKQAHDESKAMQHDNAAVIARMGDALEHLSNGDLTARIDAAFPIDHEPLRHSFNKTAARLEEVLGTLVGTIDNIHSNIEEIASGADDLSQRTARQAASLEETAAATALASTAINNVARQAADSDKLFSQASADAQQGHDLVTATKQAMEKIAQSSVAISGIIGLIDGIAFQTTLLALNAGVEAARSGEAGRGFAVVATEVRNLAEKASEAAAQIKTLITASGTDIATGVKLIEDTDTSVHSLLERLLSIRGVVTNMASSVDQQAASMATVDAAVREMDQVTQQNAAMVEEASAAARNLAHDVTGLTDLTRRFTFETAPDAHRPTGERHPLSLAA